MSETQSSEAAVDDTPLLHLFGDSARTRILAAIVQNRDRELNVSELAREAGIARPTAYDHIDDLVEIGAIEKRGKRYTLADSDLGELLYKTEGTALQNLLEVEEKL